MKTNKNLNYSIKRCGEGSAARPSAVHKLFTYPKKVTNLCTLSINQSRSIYSHTAKNKQTHLLAKHRSLCRRRRRMVESWSPTEVRLPAGRGLAACLHAFAEHFLPLLPSRSTTMVVVWPRLVCFVLNSLFLFLLRTNLLFCSPWFSSTLFECVSVFTCSSLIPSIL